MFKELLLDGGKTKTLKHLAAPPQMPLSTICKARKEMRLMELIDYLDFHWQLSPRLATNLRKMADLLDAAMNKK